MIITNKYNLPQAYVDAVNENHKPVDKHYSVTTLLKPVCEILLNRRHYNEIEQDISDMVWLIFGSAVHKIVEDADKTGFAEIKLELPVRDGYTLTGICDLYNEELMTVEDHKTSSVYKVLNKDFDDYKKQGLMYALMLREKGHYVKKLRFHILMKDWSHKDYRLAMLKNDFYPEHPIWTWEYEISEMDIDYIKKFINDKFDELILFEKVCDNDLPTCSMLERWNDGDKYALIKDGSKRATKLYENENEAKANCINGYHIELRKGEDKKCNDYCLCNKFCKYYKELKNDN